MKKWTARIGLALALLLGGIQPAYVFEGASNTMSPVGISPEAVTETPATGTATSGTAKKQLRPQPRGANAMMAIGIALLAAPVSLGGAFSR